MVCIQSMQTGSFGGLEVLAVSSGVQTYYLE